MLFCLKPFTRVRWNIIINIKVCPSIHTSIHPYIHSVIYSFIHRPDHDKMVEPLKHRCVKNSFFHLSGTFAKPPTHFGMTTSSHASSRQLKCVTKERSQQELHPTGNGCDSEQIKEGHRGQQAQTCKHKSLQRSLVLQSCWCRPSSCAPCW